MKHLFKATLLMLALMLPTTVFAHDFEVDGIYYNINGNEATVTYRGTTGSWYLNEYTGSVNIPATVTYAGTSYPVTNIGSMAFYYCSGLTSVTIPNSVTTIGTMAFGHCSGLTSITIPNSVTTIGVMAFGDCSGLTSVNIPNSVTTISENAFYYCSGLTDVTIPNSVTTIGNSAFKGCSGLTSVTIPNSVTTIGSTAFEGCSGLTSITIPNSVTSIGNSAFYGCSVLEILNFNAISCADFNSTSWPFYNENISVINIGNSVEKIPAYFAYGLRKLTSVTIPNSVTTIGDDAFSYCSGLTSITIGNSVTAIGNGAFHDCSGLTCITIPNSVTAIGSGAFDGCSGLTCITIPNSVTAIGSGAFDGCSGLTSVTIPNSVTTISDAAFCDCSGLTSISVESSNPNYDSRNNCNAIIETITNTLIAGCMNTTIPNSVTNIGNYAFSGCSGLTSVTIPNSVTTISDAAFCDCSGLTSITIPNSVTNIGNYAFSGCSALTSVTCLAVTPPTTGIYIYGGVFNQATLYVPKESIADYQAANFWKDFSQIVEFDFEVDGMYYCTLTDNTAMVIQKPNEETYQGVVIVPNTVTYDGVTYTVTGIGYEAFANADITHFVLPVTITSIDNTTFTNCHIGSLVITGNGTWTAGALAADVDQLFVMSGVTGVQGLQVNPATIYSYATVPPTCNGQTFTGYDGELHVPASSLASYFTAPYWNYFINITGDAVEPTSIALNKDSVDLLVGNQLTLTATSAPANTTPGIIIWASSNEQVATVMNGEITAVGVGECDIKAILLDQVAVCHVAVTEIPPTELTINQTFAKLEVGSQLSLTATVLPEDATDKIVTWATTNAAVATVDNQGNVTAVGPGECDITATCRDMQATCHMVVVEHFIFISLDQHEANLLPNHILMLTPSVSPVSTDLVVTSSDPAVAAARMANGKIQVVGITEGVTTITVGSADGYAEPDSCVVIVYTERGDVNMDGFVNMDDLTAMINYLLTDNAEGISLTNADVNHSGGVSMDDLTTLINFLLTDQWPLDPVIPDDPVTTQTFTVNEVSFTMVKVDGGTFTMGATPEQGESAPDSEKPVHEVTLSTFNIGQTEVTQALWQAVMGSNPSTFSDDPNRPVECVSWNDCQTFITKLNQMTGQLFRLPTEAEWEFAARGGNKSQGHKYAGSDNIDDVAWYMGNIPSQTSGTPGYGTQPVAGKAPNELSLYDMSGNVWEWCQDRYGSYTSEAQTDPIGPTTGNTRVVRGGSWYNTYATNCRTTRRNGCQTTDADTYLGLRLALDTTEVYTVNGVSFTMVPVRGGTFTMGATEEEDADYQVFIGSPQHQVTLSSYTIGQTEVTQELWLAVMGSNPSENTGDLQRPVDNVRRAECDSFIVRLNALTGKQFRLPTEAEWEFAARGGNLSQGYTYAGSDDIDEVAWYSGNSGSVSHAVATKLPNELGIYDMCGNVNEWCNDWYSLYTEEPVTNPTGPATGMSQIHRGGRYASSVKYCRITRRDGFAPGNRRAYLGFRIAQ